MSVRFICRRIQLVPNSTHLAMRDRGLCRSNLSQPKYCKLMLSPAQIIRELHCSPHLRLKTLFSKDEQKEITSYINKFCDARENIRPMRGHLERVVKLLPEKGPLQDIDELLEKYNLGSSAAVSMCYKILKKSKEPERMERKTAIAPSHYDRKMKAFVKSITPQVTDPKAINHFTALAVTQDFVGYATLEKLEEDWCTQRITNWDALDIRNLCFVDILIQLWKFLPPKDVFVTSNLAYRLAHSNQTKLYAASLSLLLARNNFDGVNPNLFEVNCRSPPRLFNLIIGNEVVSPLSMVSVLVDGLGATTPDDHAFGRSLKEVTCDNIAIEKFKNFNDEMQESVSQGLLLGKAFVEFLKA